MQRLYQDSVQVSPCSCAKLKTANRAEVSKKAHSRGKNTALNIYTQSLKHLAHMWENITGPIIMQHRKATAEAQQQNFY